MKIRNWDKFQHFKDRNPPWIRLYKTLLEDPDWHSLDGESAKILVQLWMLASEDKDKQGNLPSLNKIAFRFRLPEKEIIKYVGKLSNWLIDDDINSISSCYHADTDKNLTVSTRYQVDAPETETETETDNVLSCKHDASSVLLDYLNDKTGSGYRKVKANLDLIRARIKEGATTEDIKAVIDAKCEEWLTDKKMCKYLRPNTLFSAKNFAQYVGAIKPRDNGRVFDMNNYILRMTQ
jgi:uncharacterized phage protein (TIGR02220 family)